MSDYQTTAQKPDVYQRVTDVIVNAIETGTGSYRMPWVVRQDKGFSPIGVSTVKPYRGINTLVLWAQSQSKGYARRAMGHLSTMAVTRRAGPQGCARVTRRVLGDLRIEADGGR